MLLLKDNNMIAIIGGTSVEHAAFLEGMEPQVEENRYGKAYLLKKEDVVFLPRHGRDGMTPPHMIDHMANMRALHDLGVEKLVGIGSTGSLKKEIRTGSLLIPDDYINLFPEPSYYDAEIKHVTPGFDEQLRNRIIEIMRLRRINAIEKGVYLQTRGPRLETRAEVIFLKEYADVVGMTMATEATLAKELEIGYAGVCTVDNYAHGLTKEKLKFEDILREAQKKREKLDGLISALLEELR